MQIIKVGRRLYYTLL